MSPDWALDNETIGQIDEIDDVAYNRSLSRVGIISISNSMGKEVACSISR